MLRSILVSLGAAAFALVGASAQETSDTASTPEWRLVIHGGAGVILRENLNEDQEARYRAALETALENGAAVLREGGSAVDAVQAAVVPMENNPLFNAGFGAVFTATGEHELDASIMDGRDRNAGSVAGIKYAKNPILAARAVMDHSEHVMFAGKGADAFAAKHGIELVTNDFFDTDRRRRSLEKVLQSRERTDAERHGTVGAVAIDADGNLAAATTTGGMTAKAAGRVGDTPLVGAATYAQNGVCAVSSTGHGEYFIRVAVAKTICAEMELTEATAGEAAQSALDQVADLGGDGGVIVIDADGNYEYVFNSAGMYRGMIDPNGMETAIFEAE